MNLLLLNLGLFVFTFLGGILPLFIKQKNPNNDWLMTFGGAFLFAICFSHLIPEAMHHNDINITSLLILTGYLLQLFIQKFTHGVEHGHNCTHKHNAAASWSLVIGMGLHSLIEGLPLSSGYFSLATLIPLYFAILLHKVPSAAIIGNIFYKTNHSKSKSAIIVGLFSLITPVAAIIGMLLTEFVNSFYNIIPYIVPLVTGSFLQIATTIFHEHSSAHHKITLNKWVAILMGVGIGVLSGMSHSHSH